MNEQWKHGGTCVECRKKLYCRKPCRANQDRLNREVKTAIVKKMAKAGMPLESYLKTYISANKK